METQYPVIDLWDSEIGILIVPGKSGFLYSNQTGGYACHHPTVEGIIFPVSALLAEITSRYHMGCCGAPITEEEANSFDNMLEFLRLPLCLDRAKLAQSEEAWLHMTITPTDETPYAHFVGQEVILTYENCD